MSERIKAILDAVTDRVLGYRLVDKGLAAKKTERRLKRQAKKEAHDDREQGPPYENCGPKGARHDPSI